MKRLIRTKDEKLTELDRFRNEVELAKELILDYTEYGACQEKEKRAIFKQTITMKTLIDCLKAMELQEYKANPGRETFTTTIHW